HARLVRKCQRKKVRRKREHRRNVPRKKQPGKNLHLVNVQVLLRANAQPQKEQRQKKEQPQRKEEHLKKELRVKKPRRKDHVNENVIRMAAGCLYIVSTSLHSG